MLTKFTSFITAALVISGATVYANPVPGSNVLEAKSEQETVTVQLCVNFNLVNCYNIPLAANNCLNFNQGLTILDKTISSLVVPDGYICDLFQKYSCLSTTNPVSDMIALPGGTYNDILAVQTDNQVLNFNDQASSIICSPIFN